MIDPHELVERIDQIAGEYNKQEFKNTLAEMLDGMRDVGKGFLKIARAAQVIREKEYFKEMGYNTFDKFCSSVVGLTRKTVYLYLRIDSALEKYPDIFDSSIVMQLGSAKMDKIIVGINKIEDKVKSTTQQKTMVRHLMKDIEPNMSVGEVERCVRQHAE